jgi:hypothetical protein
MLSLAVLQPVLGLSPMTLIVLPSNPKLPVVMSMTLMLLLLWFNPKLLLKLLVATNRSGGVMHTCTGGTHSSSSFISMAH